MSHLLGVQETNSKVVYHTLNSVISRICLGSGLGSLTFNKPWEFLNTQVMGHRRKEDFHQAPYIYIYIYIYIYKEKIQKESLNKISEIF